MSRGLHPGPDHTIGGGAVGFSIQSKFLVRGQLLGYSTIPPGLGMSAWEWGPRLWRRPDNEQIATSDYRLLGA